MRWWPFIIGLAVLVPLALVPIPTHLQLLACLAAGFCFVFGYIVRQAIADAPRREERLRAAGRCTYCGYDLTGNVSGVCPECGTPVAR